MTVKTIAAASNRASAGLGLTRWNLDIVCFFGRSETVAASPDQGSSCAFKRRRRAADLLCMRRSRRSRLLPLLVLFVLAGAFAGRALTGSIPTWGTTHAGSGAQPFTAFTVSGVS